MRKRKRILISVGLLALVFLTGCSDTTIPTQEESRNSSTQESESGAQEGDGDMAENISAELPETEEISSEPGPATLLYQGQASIRVVTDEGKVIYIDPYAGDSYELPADLILVTHAHFDHSQTDKVENRNEGCRIITYAEALQDGAHRTFDLGYVTVEAVEAGYNPLHDAGNCVGYVLTFSNGKSVYVTGDTSKTEQMAYMDEMEIDYAFFCFDGVYNMGLEEAAECACLVGAKHNIPYHMTTTTTGRQFDREIAEQFDVENRLIVEDGEEILIE